MMIKFILFGTNYEDWVKEKIEETLTWHREEMQWSLNLPSKHSSLFDRLEPVSRTAEND